MRRVVTFSIFVLILVVGIYAYWYYYRPYSDDGSRVGMIQKFSRKGDIFKTYEGELLQEGFSNNRGGQFSAQYFYFSVDDENVAAQIEKLQGQVVRVRYVQYKRSLPWRGENYDARNQERGQYIVTGVETVQPPVNTPPAPAYR